MKATFKTAVKLISISILISSFTLAVYSSNTYPNKKTTKSITQQSKIAPKIKLAQFDDSQIVEPEKPIEDWMLDDNFWKIKYNFEWEKEPIEEEKPIEDWMDKFTIKNSYSQINYNDQEWMKKQSFYIL